MKTSITLKQQIIRTIFVAAISILTIHTSAQSVKESNTGAQEKTQSVKLLSFTGAVNGSKADLKWVTEAEVNVSHFIIEKSTDGVNFSDAGVFFAYGTATDKTNYSFSVNLDNSGTPVIYYRLFVTGNNGKGFYSDPCTVKTGK